MLASRLMVEPLQLRNLAWTVTTTVECVLLAQLARRKFLDRYPWFSLYVASTIVQSLVVATAYRFFDVPNMVVWKIAWCSQLIVVLLRFQAVIELMRKVLSRYLGIWALARRLLFTVGIIVMATACFFQREIGTGFPIMWNAAWSCPLGRSLSNCCCLRAITGWQSSGCTWP